MNKVILSLLLAVCVLGMALIMLNEKMRKPEQAPVAQASMNQQAPAPGVDSQAGPEAALPTLGDIAQTPKTSGGAQPPAARCGCCSGVGWAHASSSRRERSAVEGRRCRQM